MNNSEQGESRLSGFYERYMNYTDVKILEILRHRKDYQESAVIAATKIAIERQIIHSEHDLLAPEFQIIRNEKFTFFPAIDNEYQQQKLVGSIYRFLYIMSLIPVIYGFLKYGEGEINQTYLGVSAGIIWFSLSVWLNKTRKVFVFVPLFFMLALLALFLGLRIFVPDNFRILDLVMLIIGIVLPSYLLIYLKKLIKKNAHNFS